jgi:hypothetical protein
MIFPKDLQLGSILSSYMMHAGYATSVQTDCLTFAHVLRRVYDDVELFNVIQKSSCFLDAVFALGLQRRSVLTPSDMRLYVRIFVSSRLPPVVDVWNNAKKTYVDTMREPYDVVNSEAPRCNETYMYFSNTQGPERDYVASPSDVFKMMMFRRTPEVRTFTNSEAFELHKVIYSGAHVDVFEESNGHPIKMYQVGEIDKDAYTLLSGRYALRAQQ